MDDREKKLHFKIKIWWTSTVGPKGQVVIPKEIRNEMNINPWDSILFVYNPEKFHVWFIKNENLQSVIDYANSRWITIDIN